MWYARYSPRLWEEIHELLDLTDPPARQDEEDPADDVPDKTHNTQPGVMVEPRTSPDDGMAP